MTDILNIDDLASTDLKQLVIKGVTHTAAELTVQGYIDRVKEAHTVPDDATMDVKIEETIKLLIGIFPTVDQSDLRAMPLAHLSRIVEFALAAPQDIAAGVEKAPAEGNV